MSVPFPSYLDTLARGLQEGFKTTGIPHHKYGDSQNVGECIEKLFNHLSFLLFRIDKHINKVLLQGRYLPKKLNLWAAQARALKCQVSDLLQKQQYSKGHSLKCKELVEIGIKMTHHLKKCPSDELMYDKRIPAIVLTRESRPSTRLEQKYKTGDEIYSNLEVKKADRQWRTEQSLNPLQGQFVLLDQDAGMILTSAGITVPAVELKKRKLGSEPPSITQSMSGGEICREAPFHVHDAVIPAAPPESNVASISEFQHAPRSEITEEGMTLEDRATKMSSSSIEQETRLCRRNKEMQISVSGFDGHQESGSASGEIQAVHEITPITGADNLSAEQIEIESSSRAEGSEHNEESNSSPIRTDHLHPIHEDTSELLVTISVTGEMSKILNHMQETQRCYLDLVPKTEDYLFLVEEKHIKLKLDQQSILMGDHASSGLHETFQSVTGVSLPEDLILNKNGRGGRELSGADEWRPYSVIDLVEQDIPSLPEKPDCPNLVLLFLQRNNRLTHIPPSFFNSMPALRSLDLSSTRIRILPSSLFSRTELQVLMLRNCVCLDKLQGEIGKVDHMEVLDLSGTELYNLPDEVGQLTRLRLMHLSFYGPDDESEYVHLPSELISHGIISKLQALQALSIVVHPEDHRWTKIAKYIIEDVAMLKMLNYLQLYFPEVESFQHFIETNPSWKEKRLMKFKFVVGHNVRRIISRVPDGVESKYDEQGQCLRFVNGNEVPQVIKSVLMRITAFYLDHHSKIGSLSEFGVSNFEALKFCVLTECPDVEVIIDHAESRGEAFPCLEHLGVYYLWELQQISRIPLPPGSFHALKYLIINTCPKLQFILWESMLQYLSNLEEFVVEDCESVEKLIKEEKETVKSDAIILPRLRKLVLCYLPQLVSLGNGLCLSEEKISTYGCPKLILNSKPMEQKRVKQSKFLGSLQGPKLILNSQPMEQKRVKQSKFFLRGCSIVIGTCIAGRKLL